MTERLAAEYLVNPQVKVEFEESPNKSVSVMGQVIKSGNYIYTPKVIMVSGGKIMDGRAKDVKLEPGDLITVPETYF